LDIVKKKLNICLFLNRTHFGQELATNKIVRFIYQGQFLCDKNTVKSYNIKDQTTIHCHITTKPNQQQSSSSSSSSTTTTTTSNDSASANLNHEHSGSGLRLREVNYPNNNNNNQSVASQTNNNLPINRTFILNGNTTNNIDPNLIDASTPRLAQNTNSTTTTVISIDLNNLLLPLFAVLLGIIWYFRVNFKHFFSPLSTLILVIFTFIYALFLFNNIHSTSSIAANNFMMQSRILRRRQTTRQPTPPPPPQPAPADPIQN
jgi:hypothetical protein